VKRVTVASLCRTSAGDIDSAAAALADAPRSRIHVFIATSALHMEKKLRLRPDQVVAQASAAVERACASADEVEFSCEDATRSDPEFVATVCRAAVDAGATTINLPDTVGYLLPGEYAAFLLRVRDGCPELEDVALSAHCHDDLGLAVANSLAAIEAGALQIECTVNGIGERAGNAALEEVVMAMHVRADRLPYSTGVDTREIYPSSQLLASIVGFGAQPNKAVVGRNAFAHEAGIHQHGVLSNPLCYEIMTPESVGVPSSRIVLGKHSGRHALAQRYEELGAPVAAGEIDAVYRRFTELADRKKAIYDQDLLSLLGSDAGACGRPSYTVSSEARSRHAPAIGSAS
jgi:2-isopropylmalate synthase